MATDLVEVLIKKRAKLDIAFTFNMKELADLMNREGFLSGPDYDNVVGVRSMYSDKEKAGIMVSSLIKKVELNSKYYGRFLGLVKPGGRKFEDVVELLDVLPSNEQEPIPQQPHIQSSTMDSVRGSGGAGATLKAENTTLNMVDDTVLVEDDLSDILEEIECLSAEWEMIGTKIGMKTDTKRGIKQQYESPNSRLNALLTEWLQLNYDHGRHEKPSWSKLAKAVKTINGAAYEKLVQRHVMAHPKQGKVVEDGAGSSPTPAAGVRDGEGRLTVIGCPALGNKLKLQTLQLLKYKSASGSGTLRILDEAAANWRDIGDQLEIAPALLSGYHRKALGGERETLREVFVKWIEVTSKKYPTNWYGLIKLLDDVQLASIADEIEGIIIPAYVVQAKKLKK